MKSRRSFFKKLAAVVAAVALAPEIAFRAHLETPIPADYLLPDFEIMMCMAPQNTFYDFLMHSTSAEKFRKEWPEVISGPCGNVTLCKMNTLSPRELEAVFNG